MLTNAALSTSLTTKYALRHNTTLKFAVYSVSSNEGSDFCGEDETQLSGSADPYDGDTVWLVDSSEVAEKARKTNTGWYNAHYETPSHDHGFKPDDWHVTVIELSSSIRAY